MSFYYTLVSIDNGHLKSCTCPIQQGGIVIADSYSYLNVLEGFTMAALTV